MPSCTQQELAKLIGVSQTTVQRALSGHPYIKDDVREKIVDLAKKHGYRVHAGASSLRSGRTHAIGVLVFNRPRNASAQRSSMVFFEYLAGVTDRLLEYDYKTILIRDRQLTTDEQHRHPPILFREQSVDGIISTHPGLQSLTKQIEALDVPAVWLDAGRHDKSNCVWRDESEAVKTAMDRLISLGHKRIAYIGKVSSQELSEGDSFYPIHHSVIERRVAYQVLMREHQLSELCIEGEGYDGTVEALIASLRADDRPTAFISYDCEIAHRMRSACEYLGLRAGHDVSLISLDDAFSVHRSWPELGRVAFDRYAMGEYAADAMLDLIRKKSTKKSRCFPANEILGTTFRPAPEI